MFPSISKKTFLKLSLRFDNLVIYTIEACAIPGGVYTTGAWAAFGRVFTIEACAAPRGVYNTGAWAASGRVCTIEACAVPGGVYTTGAWAASGRVCTTEECTAPGGVCHKGLSWIWTCMHYRGMCLMSTGTSAYLLSNSDSPYHWYEESATPCIVDTGSRFSNRNISTNSKPKS